jgi:hypothetical protein
MATFDQADSDLASLVGSYLKSDGTPRIRKQM